MGDIVNENIDKVDVEKILDLETLDTRPLLLIGHNVFVLPSLVSKI